MANKQMTTLIVGDKVYTSDVDAGTLARVIRRSQEQEGKPVKRVPRLHNSNKGFSLLK